MFCSSSVFLSSLPFPLSLPLCPGHSFRPSVQRGGVHSKNEEHTWQAHLDRWIKFDAQYCPRFRGGLLRIKYQDETKYTKRTKDPFVAVHQYFLACSEGEMCSRFSVLASESKCFYVHPATRNEIEKLFRHSA